MGLSREEIQVKAKEYVDPWLIWRRRRPVFLTKGVRMYEVAREEPEKEHWH